MDDYTDRVKVFSILYISKITAPSLLRVSGRGEISIKTRR